MDVVARGERLDLREAGILESSRQEHLGVHPIPSQHDVGKSHAHLKSDSRFIGNQDDRPAPPEQLYESLVKRERQRTLALQIFTDRDARAEMKLIAVAEEPPALPALPEGTPHHGRSLSAEVFLISTETAQPLQQAHGKQEWLCHGGKEFKSRACGKAEDGRAPLWVWCGAEEHTRISGKGKSEEAQLPTRTGEGRA
jgi:hypothetical protein